MPQQRISGRCVSRRRFRVEVMTFWSLVVDLGFGVARSSDLKIQRRKQRQGETGSSEALRGARDKMRAEEWGRAGDRERGTKARRQRKRAGAPEIKPTSRTAPATSKGDRQSLGVWIEAPSVQAQAIP